MTGLQLVSLFAGVGGIDLAAELNGIPTIAAVEIDDAARGVLAHRFPDATLFTDVRGVTGDDLRAAGAVPERTVLAGGFPCQPFSVAGRRQGVGDEQGRGDLFWEIDRLLAEFAPAWVVLENVPGLLSIDSGRTMGAILRDLGERGYGVAYRVLDSQHFGVPQRRRRVVIVGRLGDSGAAPVQVLLEPEGGGGDSAPRLPAWPRTAGRAAGGAGGVGFRAAEHGSFTEGVGPLTRRYDKDGKDAVIVTALTSNMAGAGGGVDDNTAQGGHLVPNVKMVRSGARDPDGELPPEVWAEQPVAPTLNVMDNGGEARATVLTVTGDIAHTLRAEGADASEEARATVLTVTPIQEVGKRTGVSTDDPHAGIGIGADGDPMFTLQAQAQHAVAASTVRRLTPVECERLQGFPDGWTAHRVQQTGKDTGQVVPQADSHRYRQMGNAVTVDVFAWVLDRLRAHDEGWRP